MRSCSSLSRRRWVLIATPFLAFLVLIVGPSLITQLPDRHSADRTELATIAPAASEETTETGEWSRLELVSLERGPIRASSVVGWDGGYVAVGQPPALSRDSTVFLSSDGRRWSEVTPSPLTPPGQVSLARCGPGILVITTEAGGDVVPRYSDDGRAWDRRAWPVVRTGGATDLAGNALGAVAVIPGPPARLLFSRGCQSWQVVDLPGPRADVSGVVAFGEGFVAVGHIDGEDPTPAAWFTDDGLAWRRADIEQGSNDALTAVYSGSDGLVARGLGEFGRESAWVSSDGHRWGPLMAHPDGGSLTGSPLYLTSDGTRILGFGGRRGEPTGGELEHWISFDGTSWERLEVAGDPGARDLVARRFLLRDGLLVAQAQNDPAAVWVAVPTD
jgi:hypothetical protein